MSDQKLIAAILIPCGVLLIGAILFIQARAHRTAVTPQDSDAGSTATMQGEEIGATEPEKDPSPTTAPSASVAGGNDAVRKEQPQAAKDATPPRPFRRIEWGSLLSERDDMSPSEYYSKTVNVVLEDNRSIEIEDVHTKGYQRTGEKLEFGPTRVGGIVYRTFDGRFYQVKIENPNPYDLSTVFSQVYGPAEEFELGDTTHWVWELDNGQTRVHMFYEPPNRIFPNGLSSATITNVKLENELSALQRAEAIAQLNQAKKDF
jgi:hypothetical protein